MRDFYIILGCDCDPDRPAYGGYPYEESQLSWEGVRRGIPRFSEERKRFYSQNDVAPKITWFVRADKQLERIYGSYAYLLKEEKELWNRLEKEGDEIALHPHLWDFNGETWFQKIDSLHFKKEVLQGSVEAFRESRAKIPHSVHAGWCYQDTDTLRILSDLGVKIDCSANPGQDTLEGRIRDRANWISAPSVPYRPSSEDYLAPAASADQEGIWEVPAYSSASTVVSFIRKVKDSLEHQIKESQVQKKMVPLMTFHPFLFRSLTKHLFKQKKLSTPYFLSYFHADEFLPKKVKKGAFKFSHSLEHFWKNVHYLVTLVQKNNYQPKFMTLSEFKLILDQKK